MSFRLSLFVLLAAATLFTAAGCDISINGLNATPLIGSGNIVAEEAKTVGFREVEVGDHFELNIRQGDAFYVLVEADDNVIDLVDVARDGDLLRIGLAPGHSYALTNVTLRAEVVLPELDALHAKGACRVVMKDFDATDGVSLGVSGASKLEGDLNAKEIEIEISGASRVTLAGATDRLRVSAAGACSARLGELEAEEVDVDVSGASSAVVHATKRINADASGASKVRYSGSPSVQKIDESGASSVIPTGENGDKEYQRL